MQKTTLSIILKNLKIECDATVSKKPPINLFWFALINNSNKRQNYLLIDNENYACICATNSFSGVKNFHFFLYGYSYYYFLLLLKNITSTPVKKVIKSQKFFWWYKNSKKKQLFFHVRYQRRNNNNIQSLWCRIMYLLFNLKSTFSFYLLYY